MRYYICVTPFFPSNDSFVGPYILDQVKAIKRNSDYKVIVVKPYPFYHKADDYEYDGIKVYRCPNYALPSNLWPNGLSDRLSAKALIDKLKNIGVAIDDIVVCHAHVAQLGFYANALKELNNKIISIVQHHGFDVFATGDGRLAKYELHRKRCIAHGVSICNKADLNVGVSQRTLDYVQSYNSIKLKDTYVLYNGVDTSKFFPASEYIRPNEVFTIGCVANFWELKDQMTLLRAIKRLIYDFGKKVRAILIGFGYTREQCVRFVEDNDLTAYVEFIDRMRHEDLPDFYRSLDLFVLPSYWEAFGCVYTEAYACGTPFVGVKGQGIAEIIPDKDKDKWLIDKGDDETLAKIISHFMDEGESCQKLMVKVDSDSLISGFLRYVDSKVSVD